MSSVRPVRWAGVWSRLTTLLLLSSFLTGVIGCAPAAQPDRRVQAVATTSIVADAVRVVGRDRVNVQSLMGPGVDPHTYRARESDVRRLASAEVIFYHGLNLESKMVRVFERISHSKKVAAVAEAIPRHLLKESEQYPGHHDPHVWFDVELWSYVIEKVRDVLGEIDPEHGAEFKRNASEEIGRLKDLAKYTRERIAEIPDERRVLITAHDAFGYFGRAYGLQVKGLQGISTESEAGIRNVRELAQLIAEKDIRAVFVETSVPSRNLQAVQEAVQAKGKTVRLGGELFSDALGSAGTAEGTYYGMFKHNVDTIVNALK